MTLVNLTVNHLSTWVNSCRRSKCFGCKMGPVKEFVSNVAFVHLQSKCFGFVFSALFSNICPTSQNTKQSKKCPHCAAQLYLSVPNEVKEANLLLMRPWWNWAVKFSVTVSKISPTFSVCYYNIDIKYINREGRRGKDWSLYCHLSA